ncbi:MAG: hypothetical protein ACYC63_06240 [Armatimonadota bacterium]
MQAYYHELTTAAIVLGTTVVGLIFLKLIVVRVLLQMAKRRQTTWDRDLVNVLVAPLMALGLLLGLRMALLHSVPLKTT